MSEREPGNAFRPMRSRRRPSPAGLRRWANGSQSNGDASEFDHKERQMRIRLVGGSVAIALVALLSSVRKINDALSYRARIGTPHSRFLRLGRNFSAYAALATMEGGVSWTPRRFYCHGSNLHSRFRFTSSFRRFRSGLQP